MMTSSYSAAATSGRQAATAMPHQSSGSIPNTPEVISSIISIFDNHYYSPASEDSTSSSVCSPVSPPRMQSICSSVLIKEDLKLVIKKRQQKSRTGTPTTPTHPTLTPTTDGAASNSPRGFAATIAAATASTGSAASSPGGGQARKRPTDEESYGDEDDEDDGDVSSHGEGVSVM